MTLNEKPDPSMKIVKSKTLPQQRASGGQYVAIWANMKEPAQPFMLN